MQITKTPACGNRRVSYCFICCAINNALMLMCCFNSTLLPNMQVKSVTMSILLTKKLKKFPFVIELAIHKLSSALPTQITDFVYTNKNRQQSMDPRRKSNITKVLCVLLQCYDLVTRRILHFLNNNISAPATESWIAEKAGLSVKTVQRIFKYLHDVGILEWEKQRIRKVPTKEGYKYFFYSITRVLTDKFFDMIKLTRALVDCREGRLNGFRVIHQVIIKPCKARPKLEFLRVAPEILYGKSMFDDPAYVDKLNLTEDQKAFIDKIRDPRKRARIYQHLFSR